MRASKCCLPVVALAVMGVVAGGGTAWGQVVSRTFDTQSDFASGTCIGMDPNSMASFIHPSGAADTFPFIWIPNNGGTVSKVRTDIAQEVARYRVDPNNSCSPSRTSVDLDGSCYVGNRQAGTVVKIGSLESGIWVDRNGNGVCDTSYDRNGDTIIDANDANEVLPWGQDECVMYQVVLIDGHLGTHEPNEYPGPYDANYWGTAPRGLAVDVKNDLWAGTYAPSRYYYIDGETGDIDANRTKTVDSIHNAYGAVIDKNGMLWSSSPAKNSILALDLKPTTPNVVYSITQNPVYGICLDWQGHLLWSGGVNTSQKYGCINTTNGTSLWSKTSIAMFNGTGVACTPDNDLWAACRTSANWISRFDPNGVYKALITVPADPNYTDPNSNPCGVAVDRAGKVWTFNGNNAWVHRINPATNTIEKSFKTWGSGGHYSYSDMTGVVSRSITTRTGTWTVVIDGLIAGCQWGRISWLSYDSFLGGPYGYTVVRARTSEDPNNPRIWSIAETAVSGEPLANTPARRYLELTVRLTNYDPNNPAPTIFPMLDWVSVATVLTPPVLSAEPNTTYGTTNTIFWSSVPNAGEYRAQCDDDPNFGSPVDSNWVTGTSFKFTGLTIGTKYYYRVMARSASNHDVYSEWSNVVSSTQSSLCHLNLTITNSSYGTVTVLPDPPGRLYAFGTLVDLTAVPDSSRIFEGWTIYDPNFPGDPAHSRTDANSHIQLTMNNDYDVEAKFKCGSGLDQMLPPLLMVFSAWFVSARYVRRSKRTTGR